MTRNLSSRNAMVDWQVAPTLYEMKNYDAPKIDYRRQVEEFIQPLTLKSLRKKVFYTISTNVICADIRSSSEEIDPIERDLYLPVEIAISKWTLGDALNFSKEKKLSTKHWMINPGEPPRGTRVYASDHMNEHKIKLTYGRSTENDLYFSPCLSDVMKQINSWLSSDRLVFSVNLKRVRQDIGCLKWLNKATDYKSKPIKVLSLQDLYVVLIRRLNPESGTDIGLGLSKYRTLYSVDTSETKLKCVYHVAIGNDNDDGDCANCASAVSQACTIALIEDVNIFTDIFIDKNPGSNSEQNHQS